MSNEKASPEFYDASTVKRRERRSGEQMTAFLEAIHGVLDGEEGQITIRHLFYRLVGLGVIPKLETSYQQLIKHLSKWRRSGVIPWDAFADSTRWHIKSPTFDGLDDAIQNTVETYRRNLWTDQQFYVECWCEKDAVAGILAKAAQLFGVPVFVCRGFASLSSLFNAANTFREWADRGKECVVYHFGDFDPSGVAAGDSIVKAFREDFKVNVKFQRAAVTKEQIREHRLPTRPVKTSDSRAAKWKGGDCVELDTMPPAVIRGLVQSCIYRHLNSDKWEVLQKVEAEEKRTLESLRDSGLWRKSK